MLTWGGRRPGAPPPPVPHLCPPHQVRQPWATGVAGSRALAHARQKESSTFLSRADSLRKLHQGLSWGSGVRRQGPGACCARLSPDPYHAPNFLLHLVPSAQRAATEGGGGAAELHCRARLLEAARPQQAARSDPRLPGHLCAAREWRAPRPTHHPGRHAGRGPGVTLGGGRVGETSIFHFLFGAQVCSPPLPALRGTVTPRHPAVSG